MKAISLALMAALAMSVVGAVATGKKPNIFFMLVGVRMSRLRSPVMLNSAVR